MTWLLSLHAFATLFMVGLIWFVQIVHYPLFDRVGKQGFAQYEADHTARTLWVVGPPMLLEAACTGLLVLTRPDSHVAWIGFALLAVVWISTALGPVRQHRRLAEGFDAGAYRALVASNWIRTIAWTVRGVLAVMLLASAS
jgi:hypothetical protein